MTQQCPVCGSPGEMGLFEFYCTDKACRNYMPLREDETPTNPSITVPSIFDEDWPFDAPIPEPIKSYYLEFRSQVDLLPERAAKGLILFEEVVRFAQTTSPVLPDPLPPGIIPGPLRPVPVDMDIGLTPSRPSPDTCWDHKCWFYSARVPVWDLVGAFYWKEGG